jgi:hypothetical protein
MPTFDEVICFAVIGSIVQKKKLKRKRNREWYKQWLLERDRFEIIALLMEKISASETSVNFYQAIRRNNPEDIHHLTFIH